jgi:hypothetical protein
MPTRHAGPSASGVKILTGDAGAHASQVDMLTGDAGAYASPVDILTSPAGAYASRVDVPPRLRGLPPRVPLRPDTLRRTSREPHPPG